MPAAMIEMGRFTTFNAFMNERLILASVAAKRTVRKRPRSVVENDAQVRLHLHKEIEVSVTCHYSRAWRRWRCRRCEALFANVYCKPIIFPGNSTVHGIGLLEPRFVG